MLTIFLILNILLPYGTYHAASTFLNWSDRRQKSPTRHMNEICAALTLGTTIYFLGGQSESFSPLYAALTSLTAVCHGLATELTSLRTSLSRFREWRWQMWITTACTVALILAFGVIHVKFAIARWGVKVAVGGYLGTFTLLPLFLAALVAGVYFLEVQQGQGGKSDEFEMVVGDEERMEMLDHAANHHHQHDEDDDDDDVDGLEGTGEGVRTIPPLPIPRAGAVKIQRVLRVHLHHYQIFAYLALFTRFPTIWSRCAAGLALGCMMHGISAYGVDSIFEYEEDRP